MSSKLSKGSGASFRKAKRLNNLAADGEMCGKITYFFTAVAPIATLPIASVADQTASTNCETEHPVEYPVAIAPLEPPVPTSERLPITAVSAVELHSDECHRQEHPAVKHPAFCPVECPTEPTSFSTDNTTEHEPFLNQLSASTDIDLHIGASLTNWSY